MEKDEATAASFFFIAMSDFDVFLGIILVDG